MLELFGLDPEKKVKHLSKGMLTKLALLLAVSHEPELLLLDEPLSGLDPIAREEFLDGVLRTICDRGQTVLISSHMLDDVRRLGRHGGHPLRGAASGAGQPRRAADLHQTHLRHAPRRLPARTAARGHHLAAQFRAGSGRSRSATFRRRRPSKSGRWKASSTSRWSIWAWKNCSRISLEGSGWGNELSLPSPSGRGAGGEGGRN